MICPACKHTNLLGTDYCEECGVPLIHEERLQAQAENPNKRILSDPIYKVSFKDPVFSKPSASVAEVVRQMKLQKVGCALVIDENNLLGIFTERDILKRAAKPNINLEEMPVSSLMTPSPRTLEETDSISYALNQMTMGNYRHVAIRRRDGSFTSFAGVDMLRYLF